MLSNTNELFKFFTIQTIDDGIGGFNHSYENQFEAFGNIALVHIDKNNHKTYRLNLKPERNRNYFQDHIHLIQNKDKKFIVRNVKLDKKQVKIECYEYDDTKTLI